MRIPLTRATIDQEFLNLRVHLLAQQAIRVPFVVLVVALIVCFALRASVSFDRLLFWIVMFVGASIPRALFARTLLKQSSRDNPDRDYQLFTLFAAINGFAAGLSTLLFFPSISSAEQAFIGMVLTGLVAGGVATSGSSPSVLASYALSALLPLGFSWNLYGNDRSHLVTWLIVIFSTMMVVYARDGKKVLYESFLIRRQRDEAYALLQQKNVEVVQANAAIESLAQTKTRVLAAASHDLRQPLHALSIYSAVLSANPNANTLKEIGSNINQLVSSLAALLDALLDLSQLDSHSFPTQNSQADLACIGKKIAQEFEHRTHLKDLSLDIQLMPAPVFSDPLILERIVRNLVDNAVKYTEVGNISIRSQVRDGFSCIYVEDSGKGIASDQLDKIFEEFYQIDNPGRDRSLGLGLGLSIVQRMGKLIGAELSIQSTPNVGTCIKISLPAHTENFISNAEPIPRTDLLVGKNILLIDDEFSIIASTTALLEIWGVHAYSATDMNDALEIIKVNSNIDFIIADLRLRNGENGIHVIQNLRQILGNIPALIISGETSAERLSDAKSYGLTTLQKPISADLLYLNLLRHLDLN